METARGIDTIDRNASESKSVPILDSEYNLVKFKVWT